MAEESKIKQIPQSKMHEANAQSKFCKEYCIKEMLQGKLHQANYLKQTPQTAKNMLHNTNCCCGTFFL